MRMKVSAIVAAVFLALITPVNSPLAHAAVSDGVGVSQNGLQLFYDVNNYNGITGNTLKDLSGNSRDALISQVSSQPSRSTANGGHLSFNGSGGFATVPEYNFPNYSGISVSFYANFGSSAGSFERIIDFGSRDAYNNLEVGRVAGLPDFFAEAWSGGTSPGWCRANGAIDSNWHFWVVTFGSGYCNIYRDNVQLVTNYVYNSLPIAGSWSKMYIGKSNWADAAFEGGIAELAFYNRVIGPSEMTQNYYAALDQTAPSYTGTATFNVNEGQTSVGSISTSESSYIIPTSGTMDTNRFTLSGSTLSFSSTPNYESPASVSSNNSYRYYFQLMDLNGNVSASTSVLTINVVDLVESTSLSIPALSGTAYKGRDVTITVTPSGDGTSIPGRVTYSIAGKRIAGCYRKVYSGSGNSTCTWKPTFQGYRDLVVTFSPTNANFSSATSSKTLFVSKRSTTR